MLEQVIWSANGRVHVNPSPDEVQRYQLRQASYTKSVRSSIPDAWRRRSVWTGSGLSTNIELPEEAPIVVEHGAQGVPNRVLHEPQIASG